MIRFDWSGVLWVTSVLVPTVAAGALYKANPGYGRDLDGTPKQSENRKAVFRGAYATARTNHRWQWRTTFQSAGASRPVAGSLAITPSTAKRGESGSLLIVLRVPEGANIASMQWQVSASAGITVSPADIVAGSAAAAVEKSVACSAMRGSPPTVKCLLAGGQKRLKDGPVAVIRYRVDRQARAGELSVRVDNAIAVSTDLKTVSLGRAEGVLTIE